MKHEKHIGLDQEAVEKYILERSSPEEEKLYQLYRKTHVRLYHPRRSSDHLSGLFLSMISQMIRPTTILEIGTFSGYGTICLAKGLTENGVIHTIEVNDEMESFIREAFHENQITSKVKLHLGDAKTIIPDLQETFDLIFIDAEKDEYSEYYDLVIEKVRPGGFILADNVLWSGKVLEENPLSKDHFTKGILEFNKKVQADPKVENLLLPIFDGITIIKKH